MIRLVLSGLLILEGLYTAVWIAGLIPTLVAYDALTLTVIAARGAVGGLEFVAGWWLGSRRPGAGALATWTLLASAALLTVELGARLAPSDLDPAFRWPFVAGYWVYTLLAAAWLWQAGR